MARYSSSELMSARRRSPSIWCDESEGLRRLGVSFLRNQAIGIAAIDMFVAVSASFQLLYVMIILAHGRTRIVRFDVTQHPTAAWLAQQVFEAFPWETAPRFLLRDRDASYGSVRHHAHPGRIL